MTEDTTRLQLYRDLGKVESSLKALTASIDSFKTESVEGRAKLYASLETMAKRTADLETKVDRLREDVDSLQPLADEARRWRERGIGAALGFSSMGAMFGGGMVFFGDRVKAFLGIGG